MRIRKIYVTIEILLILFLILLQSGCIGTQKTSPTVAIPESLDEYVVEKVGDKILGTDETTGRVTYGTDATEIIQAGINENKNVLIHCGNYKIMSPISPISNREIYGEGECTVLENANNTDIFARTSQFSYSTFRDFRIEGNRSNNAKGHGFNFTISTGSASVFKLEFYRLYINGTPEDGIRGDINLERYNANDWILEDVKFAFLGGNGTWLRNVDDSNWRNVDVKNASYYGFYFTDGGGNFYNHIHAYWNSRSGAYFDTTNYNTCSECYFENNDEDGVVLYKTNFSKVVNSWIWNNGRTIRGSGINVTDSLYNIFSGNIIQNIDSQSQNYGLHEAGKSNHNIITSNIFFNNTISQIVISGVNTINSTNIIKR